MKICVAVSGDINRRGSQLEDQLEVEITKILFNEIQGLGIPDLAGFRLYFSLQKAQPASPCAPLQRKFCGSASTSSCVQQCFLDPGFISRHEALLLSYFKSVLLLWQ